MAGPGSRNGSNRGGRDGNKSGGKGSGAGGNDRNGKSMQGRGGQADVAGRNTATGDSADNGSHRGREDSATTRARNAFAANRVMDATTHLSDPKQATPSSRRSFDHARQAMSLDDKQAVASSVTDHVNRNINKAFDVATPLSSFLSPAAPVATQLAKSSYNANTYDDMMTEMGAPLSTADVVNKTAEGFVPGLLASAVAPVGAQLGYKTGGILGAYAGGSLAKKGVKEGLEHQMAQGGTTPEDTLDRSSDSQQRTTPTQVASQTPTNSINNAKSAFGYAKVDVDKYRNGLANVKV